MGGYMSVPSPAVNSYNTAGYSSTAPTGSAYTYTAFSGSGPSREDALPNSKYVYMNFDNDYSDTQYSNNSPAGDKPFHRNKGAEGSENGGRSTASSTDSYSGARLRPFSQNNPAHQQYHPYKR